MTSRADDDLRSSFQEAARLLDAGLLMAQRALSQQPIRLWDWCNRSGWDKTGYPYYVWSFVLFTDLDREGRIHRSAVHLHYLEPWDVGDARELKVKTIAEIFRIGAVSDAIDVAEQTVPLADLAGPDALASLIRAALERTSARLARLR